MHLLRAMFCSEQVLMFFQSSVKRALSFFNTSSKTSAKKVFSRGGNVFVICVFFPVDAGDDFGKTLFDEV